MSHYGIHDLESAPEKSRPALESLRHAFGLIPNLAATMAGSPALLGGFVGAFGNFHGGTFSGREKQVLLLTGAVTNTCSWAVAFHSTMALKEGVSAGDVGAIRERRVPGDARLAALSTFARALIEERGHLGDQAVAAFTGAGFGHDQVLEVIAGLAVSMMSSYAGNITRPPIEEPFAAQRWDE